jgi:hypothetical protein
MVLTFFPMVDISVIRAGEGYLKAGERRPLGSQIAKAMVKGYQGDDLSLTIIPSCQTFCFIWCT